MSEVILKAENISKQYRLGVVGTGTLSHDLNRFWHRIRGKEDPYTKIGAVNDRSSQASEDYVWALRDINFEVKKGEVLGIIGKNGAGKSTLLKILSRVTGPTTGSIKTKGRIASLLEVGTGFHPELTGRENIYLNGAILGMTKAEVNAKIDEIIEFSGCAMYVDTPVKRYSSGMRVRLAFAVAAHLEPDILVIDEVLAVGDAEFQKKAIGKMQDISQGEGRTVLFVSHNMASVKSLCTRAIVLENGSTIFEGGTNEAVDFYIENNENKLAFRKGYHSTNKKNPIQSIEILQKIIVTGDKIDFSIKLNLSGKKKSNLHIGIYDLNDDKIMHLSSEYFNDGYLDNNKDAYNCYIEKLPLPEGIYYVNLGLLSDNLVVEELKKCLSFQVVNGDYYNCGFNVRKSALKAKTLIDYEWK